MAPLTADAKRLRTVIIAVPVFVVTSVILYRRAYLGEQQRKLPPRPVGDDVPSSIFEIAGVEVGSERWIQKEEERRERERLRQQAEAENKS